MKLELKKMIKDGLHKMLPVCPRQPLKLESHQVHINLSKLIYVVYFFVKWKSSLC